MRISESVSFIVGVLAAVFFLIFGSFETSNITLTLRIIFALIAGIAFIIKFLEDWNRQLFSVGLILLILACAIEVVSCSFQYA